MRRVPFFGSVSARTRSVAFLSRFFQFFETEEKDTHRFQGIPGFARDDDESGFPVDEIHVGFEDRRINGVDNEQFHRVRRFKNFLDHFGSRPDPPMPIQTTVRIRSALIRMAASFTCSIICLL